MNSKQRLISILAGIAMLAMPAAASARDHGQHRGFKARPAHEFRVARPAHNFAAPVAVRRNFDRRAARVNRWHDGYRRGDWAQPYAGGYGYNYVPAAPVTGYAAPYYGGSACGNAQRTMNQVRLDRRTGHPAAANVLLRRHRGMVRSCGYAGQADSGLFNGLGAAPGYAGYGTPYAANPYGYGAASALTPLIQQFIR
ncbi:MAG: hypothetical protein ACREQI_13325 [Candidatus Binataceae bacterium]